MSDMDGGRVARRDHAERSERGENRRLRDAANTHEAKAGVIKGGVQAVSNVKV